MQNSTNTFILLLRSREDIVFRWCWAAAGLDSHFLPDGTCPGPGYESQGPETPAWWSCGVSRESTPQQGGVRTFQCLACGTMRMAHSEEFGVSI